MDIQAHPAGRRLSRPGPPQQSPRKDWTSSSHGCPRRGSGNTLITHRPRHYDYLSILFFFLCETECHPSSERTKLSDNYSCFFFLFCEFFPTQIHRLRQQLADVALGKAFLLQGGDCAELFDYCSQVKKKQKLSWTLNTNNRSICVFFFICHPFAMQGLVAENNNKKKASTSTNTPTL